MFLGPVCPLLLTLVTPQLQMEHLRTSLDASEKAKEQLKAELYTLDRWAVLEAERDKRESHLFALTCILLRSFLTATMKQYD